MQKIGRNEIQKIVKENCIKIFWKKQNNNKFFGMNFKRFLKKIILKIFEKKTILNSLKETKKFCTKKLSN